MKVLKIESWTFDMKITTFITQKMLLDYTLKIGEKSC